MVGEGTASRSVSMLKNVFVFRCPERSVLSTTVLQCCCMQRCAETRLRNSQSRCGIAPLAAQRSRIMYGSSTAATRVLCVWCVCVPRRVARALQEPTRDDAALHERRRLPLFFAAEATCNYCARCAEARISKHDGLQGSSHSRLSRLLSSASFFPSFFSQRCAPFACNIFPALAPPVLNQAQPESPFTPHSWLRDAIPSSSTLYNSSLAPFLSIIYRSNHSRCAWIEVSHSLVCSAR